MLNDAGADVVGIVAYTHFKMQEQRVEQQQQKAELEELVVCNGRTTATSSPSDSGSMAGSDTRE